MDGKEFWELYKRTVEKSHWSPAGMEMEENENTTGGVIRLLKIQFEVDGDSKVPKPVFFNSILMIQRLIKHRPGKKED